MSGVAHDYACATHSLRFQTMLHPLIHFPPQPASYTVISNPHARDDCKLWPESLELWVNFQPNSEDMNSLRSWLRAGRSITGDRFQLPKKSSRKVHCLLCGRRRYNLGSLQIAVLLLLLPLAHRHDTAKFLQFSAFCLRNHSGTPPWW